MLRTLAQFQVVIDSFGVDAVLVAAFDEVVDTTDWIVQRVDVYYELLHDCRRKALHEHDRNDSLRKGN